MPHIVNDGGSAAFASTLYPVTGDYQVVEF